jgi:hypothetical protein
VKEQKRPWYGQHCVNEARKSAILFGDLTLFRPAFLSRFRQAFCPLLDLGRAVVLRLAARESPELLSRPVHGVASLVSYALVCNPIRMPIAAPQNAASEFLFHERADLAGTMFQA